MGNPVGRDQPIHTEIAVVGVVAEIPAVAVAGPAFLVLSQLDRMVAPFPNKSAAQSVITLDQLLIILRVSRTVAHGVDILAQHHGLVRLTGEIILNFFQGRIHPAVEVQAGEIVLPGFVPVETALVMNRTGGIIRLDPAGGGFEVFAVSRFVAQRPDHHGGTVFISHHTAAHTVGKGFPESGIRRQLTKALLVGHAAVHH